MTLNEAKEAVITRFLTAWGSTTPVILDNEVAGTTATWTRLVIRSTTSRQETLGPIGYRRHRRNACVYVSLFTPRNAGSQAADLLATQVLGILESVSFSGIDTWTAQVTEMGVHDAWYSVVVEVPFSYYETK